MFESAVTCHALFSQVSDDLLVLIAVINWSEPRRLFVLPLLIPQHSLLRVRLLHIHLFRSSTSTLGTTKVTKGQHGESDVSC